MTNHEATVQSGQTWKAQSYDDNVRFVSVYGEAVLDWLGARPGERILDLGCGDGALTAQLAESGATLVGVDGAPDFVRAARERGIDARLHDGHDLPFEDEFDAVFSNAALHWMTDPQAVLGGVTRALKPGGRFVGEFGGHGNVAAIVTAMRAVCRRYDGDPALGFPWYFPTPDAYSALLQEAGFVVDRISHFARPTPLPTGIHGWLGVFCQPFFDQFGDRRDAVIDDVVDALETSLKLPDGTWIADYVRLRFAAHRSE
ncbi:MAG: class I SAM-dependent methyltransferase [Pseudomonadota bacterium]